MASGALNTLAPSRTAAERTHVATTYSRSNGGSLRMSTASKLGSGRVSASCGRYQSSSLSVSETRVAVTAVLPRHCRSLTSHSHTPCPRACAARIIVTDVSLYALSESGGSTMKRNCLVARLLALRNHEVDGGAKLRVGERLVAAFGRHRAFAFQRRLQERIHAGLDAGRPGFLIADFWGAAYAGRVARHAHLVENCLAIRCTGLLLLLRRRLRHCRRCCGDLLLWLRRLRLRGRRLLEFCGRLIRHEDNRTRHLV